MSALQTINEVQSDIRGMECLVLYYQNAILRKKIAIEEIVTSAQVRLENPLPPAGAVPALGRVENPARPAPSLQRPIIHRDGSPTVRQMIMGHAHLLPQPFTARILRKTLAAADPAHAHKLGGGLYQAIKTLVYSGWLQETAAGLQVAKMP